MFENEFEKIIVLAERKGKNPKSILFIHSTGFEIPQESILLSIGSYKHKKEMLDSVRLLLDMGYKLYGSMGTSDYYNEHGLHVVTIDWMFGSSKDTKEQVLI